MWAIVIIVQALQKYMVIRYLDPWGFEFTLGLHMAQCRCYRVV